MRVAHVLDDLTAVGGVQTYLTQLLPALRERGVESVLIAAAGPAEWVGTSVVTVAGLDADGPRLSADALVGLERALGDASPDVVYVHIALSPAVADAASAYAPVVVYAHDFFMRCPGGARYLHRSVRFCQEGPGARCFVRAYTERSTNRRPDRVLRAYRRVRAWPATLPALRRVLVASPFVRDVLAAEGVELDRLRVVPYPIAPATTVDAPQTRDVLYLGRLTASKGVHVLLEALANLEGVTVAIAGDGPERASLEERAARLDLVGRVEFLGWVDQSARPSLFASARVLALPSLWQEPFGMVGVEAFAAGLPVVASDVGGIPSWLHEGAAGLLVPAGDAARLADAISRVLGDEELRSELAARGPREAERFSMESHLELLLPELEGSA